MQQTPPLGEAAPETTDPGEAQQPPMVDAAPPGDGRDEVAVTHVDEDLPVTEGQAPTGEAQVDGAALAGAPAEGDWLDRICPYLLSEDGTYRSTQPDPGHRCTAQDPPGTLPAAFQERFCLTERHVRCEMFKYAQSARSAALDREGIPAAQLQSARFRPAVRSVPLALGPSSPDRGGDGGGWPRPLILAAVGIGFVAVLTLAFILLMGGSGGSGPGAGGSPSPSASAASTPTPTPRLIVTPPPESSGEPGASAASSLAPDAEADILAQYEVQDGEALLKIAETFGVTRRDIILANPGMVEAKPYTQPGDIILVPVSPDLSAEAVAAIEALPGFIGYGDALPVTIGSPVPAE